MNGLKKVFDKTGFFTITKVFELQFIEKIIQEINDAKDVKKYFDRNGKIRRIEKLYDKGENLKVLNKKILDSLNNIFSKNFTIFKDKYNPKPPGGEGFYAHYDGVFKFKNIQNKEKNGWYEYTNFFINVLIALDPCNAQNGTIELASAEINNFESLYKKTKKNGTPDLTLDEEKKLQFNSVDLDVGDVLIFSNTCPHRSKKNASNKERKTLYYTYSLLSEKSQYNNYFFDKDNSGNITSKSLSGDI
tara:strand:- start:3727 stop:4464 length:738 start_codon:yes stop_codon:yes gene_type:complete